MGLDLSSDQFKRPSLYRLHHSYHARKSLQSRVVWYRSFSRRPSSCISSSLFLLSSVGFLQHRRTAPLIVTQKRIWTNPNRLDGSNTASQPFPAANRTTKIKYPKKKPIVKTPFRFISGAGNRCKQESGHRFPESAGILSAPLQALLSL